MCRCRGEEEAQYAFMTEVEEGKEAQSLLQLGEKIGEKNKATEHTTTKAGWRRRYARRRFARRRAARRRFARRRYRYARRRWAHNLDLLTSMMLMRSFICASI
jgi:hypothetical protein